jgi:hypothetical protein
MNSLKEKVRQFYRFLNPGFQNLFMEYHVKFEPRFGHGKPPHPELYQIIDSNRRKYDDLLNKSLKYIENISIIRDAKNETDPKLPVWNSGYLPGMDIIGIYTLLAENKPNTYLEIGSGNSTKVAYKAKTEQHLNTEIISVDPKPRAEVDAISNTIIRQPFENIDLSRILDLQDNDVLFVDNSHRILPNSDALVFFTEILPRLHKGVIVHIHDIYLPYDYPQFMCDRFYTEQYGLAIWLMAYPDKFDILLPNYFVSEDKQLSEILYPFWERPNLKNVERHGGSFWFRINK